MPEAKDLHDSADGSPARQARRGLTSEQQATWFAYRRVVLRLNCSSTGLDPDLLSPLHEALDQIHEQIVARGALPRPSGQQSRWTSTGNN